MTTTPDAAGPLDVKVRWPRVRTTSKTALAFEGRYKGHDIAIDRADRADNWYISVRGPDGLFCYDGWWPDSSRKTQREAVLEALQGAMLWTPNAELKGGAK